MALAITWGGFADTDLDFSEFFSGAHTIAVRFMLQYPHTFIGPMLSVDGMPQGKLPPLMPGCRLASRQQMPDRLGDVAFEQAFEGVSTAGPDHDREHRQRRRCSRR